jgi:hypothetical protein
VPVLRVIRHDHATVPWRAWGDAPREAELVLLTLRLSLYLPRSTYPMLRTDICTFNSGADTFQPICMYSADNLNLGLVHQRYADFRSFSECTDDRH